MSKFKVGDKVTVTGCTGGHKFSIGTAVIIKEISIDEDYICEDNTGEWWYMGDEELEMYNG